MKVCCKLAKELYGLSKVYQICPICEHVYCNEYPDFTLQCECGKYPLIKAK